LSYIDSKKRIFRRRRANGVAPTVVCIAKKIQVKVSVILYSLYLLYLLFQENKSFGASTTCIHPLM
jgi:hypothetical protein